jgi:hypothetical protein
LLTKAGRAKLELLELSPALKEQRDEWLDCKASAMVRDFWN